MYFHDSTVSEGGANRQYNVNTEFSDLPRFVPICSFVRAQPDWLFISVMMVIMGMKSAMTMVPTMAARKTIMIPMTRVWRRLLS